MYPKEQAKQEIVNAIDEIMDKYNLEMCVNHSFVYDEDNEQICINDWELSTSQYGIGIENICEALLPKDYGKVKE